MDAADTFPAASAAVAVIDFTVPSNNCPSFGVKVTVEPEVVKVNFVVMSVGPVVPGANSLVLVASELAASVTVITPVAAAAVTVGAAG